MEKKYQRMIRVSSAISLIMIALKPCLVLANIKLTQERSIAIVLSMVAGA